MACDSEGTAWLRLQGQHLIWGGTAGHWTGAPRTKSQFPRPEGPSFPAPSQRGPGLTGECLVSGGGAGRRGRGQERWERCWVASWLRSGHCPLSICTGIPLGAWGSSGHGPS